MEARGIEPRSENRSETASTCVCLACGLRQQEPDRPCCQTIFLNLTQRAEATRYASPNLRYSGAASGGLPPEQVREAEAYAASARLELAVKKFPVGFTRTPGTWTRSDSLTRPVETDRPHLSNAGER